jgi:di/tripeptidase
MPLSEDDQRRVHGDEERLPMASFVKGVDCLVHIVTEFSVNK